MTDAAQPPASGESTVERIARNLDAIRAANQSDQPSPGVVAGPDGPRPAKALGWFAAAVTNDLHLTVSSIIIFTCLAIAEFWAAESPHFIKLAALATTYLIGNSAGKANGGNGRP